MLFDELGFNEVKKNVSLGQHRLIMFLVDITTNNE